MHIAEEKLFQRGSWKKNLFKKFILIPVELTYSVTFVSGVQESDSVILYITQWSSRKVSS